MLFLGGDVWSNVKNLTLSSLKSCAVFNLHLFDPSFVRQNLRTCQNFKGRGERGIGVAFRIGHSRTLSSSGGGNGGDDLHIAIFWRVGENSSLLCGGGEAGL